MLIFNIMKHCSLKIFTCNYIKVLYTDSISSNFPESIAKIQLTQTSWERRNIIQFFRWEKLKYKEKWFKQRFTANQCQSRKRIRSFPYGFPHFNKKLHNNAKKKSLVTSTSLTDASAPMVLTRSNVKHLNVKLAAH